MTAAILSAVIVIAPFAKSEPVFVTESLNNYALGYMSWGVKHMGLDVLQKNLEKRAIYPRSRSRLSTRELTRTTNTLKTAIQTTATIFLTTIPTLTTPSTTALW